MLAGGLEHDGHVAAQLLPRQGEVDALGRADGVGVDARLQRPHVVGPHPGRVDDDRGPHVYRRQGGPVRSRPGQGRGEGAVDPARAVAMEAAHGGVGRHRDAVFQGRGAGQGQGEAGVVGLGVVVHEPRHQAVPPQGGHVGERFVHAHPAVALADAQPAREVVEPQRHRVGTGQGLVEHPVLAEQGDEEGQGCDQVGRVVKQQLSLGQVLVDEEVLPLLQVAQAAVYQLGGLGGRPRGQVGAVHEACAQAPGGRVEGHARPRHPSSDHQQVEGLGRQPGQCGLPVEGGGVQGHRPE